MLDIMLKEVKEHGSSELPINAYDVVYNFGFTQILPCHWHEECEIIYIVKGSSVFCVGETSIEAHAGQIIFVNSNELHSSYCENPSGCSYTAIVFHMSFLNSNNYDLIQTHYINPLLFKQYLFPLTVNSNDSVKQEILSFVQFIIQSLMDKKSGYELSVKGGFYLLLSILSQNNLLVERQLETTHYKEDRSDVIKKILQYITENYTEAIYIDDLANYVNMSRYHFCRFFKKYIGMTPIEYLNLIRINEAYKLLQYRNITVTEAALQTGFENLSYFTKTFKKYKGISPSKLIKTKGDSKEFALANSRVELGQ